METKELSDGQRVRVLLDPLSHGDDMTCGLATYEVVRVDEVVVPFANGDEELQVAVVKVVRMECVDYFDDTPREDDGWGKLVGEYESWLRADGKWVHSTTNVGVDFVPEVDEIVEMSQRISKTYLVFDLDNLTQHELIEVWGSEDAAQKRVDELNEQKNARGESASWIWDQRTLQ